MERSIALFGTEAAPPERRTLHAGPVSVTFEAGSLRWIRLGSIELLQSIAFLVRDSGWGTATPDLSDVAIEDTGDTFTISFQTCCKTRDGTLDWSGTITGAADGTIVFEAVATPRGSFKTNRTGFVVLHPLAGIVGAPVRVTYVDGSSEDSRFPELIDPYQPFKSIRALAHEAAPGLTSVCTMEGDAWEMEDHRNWGDASYKTYVRLLDWGFPYELAAGEPVRQRVTVTLEGDPASIRRDDTATPVRLSLGDARAPQFPRIGLGLPKARLEQAASVAALLGGPVRPAFLHCRLTPSEDDIAGLVAGYAAVAAKVGAPIVLEVILSSVEDIEATLAGVAQALAEAGVKPSAISVVPAPPILQLNPVDTKDEAAIAAIPAAARAAFGDVPLGGGVFGFFTELNRNRPPFAEVDFIGHMSSAIVHAADDEAVMENLDAFADIIRSARQISGGKPHRLGPSNIAMDTNPYGQLLENPEQLRMTMVRMDPRQRGLFAAAWTVGLVAEAARCGVEELVTGAPVGELGLIHVPADYAQPHFDDDGAAVVYPLYHVVRGAMHGSGAEGLAVESSDPARLRGFGYRRDGEHHLWLANLTGERLELLLPDEIPQRATLSVLDAEDFAEAVADADYVARAAREIAARQLTLDAYAVARMSW